MVLPLSVPTTSIWPTRTVSTFHMHRIISSINNNKFVRIANMTRIGSMSSLHRRPSSLVHKSLLVTLHPVGPLPFPVSSLLAHRCLSLASERSYTPVKGVGDGSFGTVWLCDWHTPLASSISLAPMQQGAGAKPEWQGKRLVAIKRMKKRWDGGWDECRRHPELEVRNYTVGILLADLFEFLYSHSGPSLRMKM